VRNDGTGSTHYAWDYRNRLTDVTFKDGSGAVTGSIHYAYADNNNRISQTVKDASGTVTLSEFYVYDGSNLLLVLDQVFMGTLAANAPPESQKHF
jgi:hypothetical protein